MVASMLLGLFALKIGFSHFKEKKDKFLSIVLGLLSPVVSLILDIIVI